MSTSLNLLAASTLAVALAFAAVPQAALATQQATKAASSVTATPAKKHTPQQQRMADCSHQAKLDGKKGAERKAFMSSCLKGKTASSTANSAPQPKAGIKATAINLK